MRLFPNSLAIFAVAAAVGLAPGSALAQTFLACQLSVDDGARVDPPSTLILRVSPDEFSDFRDGAWGRNLCGAHGGGEAPDVQCAIRDHHFQADWVWDSNVGKLERHVLLNLNTGELTDRDHNGLERKGVCRPTSEPSAAHPPAKP